MQYNQQIEFDCNCNNYGDYGFIKVSNSKIIFSINKFKCPTDFKKFVEDNFLDFAKVNYYAMNFDNCGVTDRKRKLSTFLKSIWDQKDNVACTLLIKSLSYYCSLGICENDIIEKVIKTVMPNCCYTKAIENGRYVWKLDVNKKFRKGIGLAFAFSYISNYFDKDKTWNYIKKHCYLKDNIWSYKNNKCKDIIEKTFLSYFKDGGEILEKNATQTGTEFNLFIPFSKVVDIDGNDFLGKEVSTDDYSYVSGVASTSNIDRDDERVSKNFIGKMNKTGKGLPILDNTHYVSSAKDNIGVIVETGEGDNEFTIKAKLMKPSDSDRVDFILKQMKTGIKYGFSIGGRITKVFREFNEKLKKEVWVLDDGELFHVTLTTQPANADTFANIAQKAIMAEKSKYSKSIDCSNYKHSSRLSKQADQEVDIDKLPDEAFPIDTDKKVYKDYPHHFIDSNNVMFLQKELLVNSYINAVKSKANHAVLKHLSNHLHVIGIYQQISEMENMAKTLDDIDIIKDISEKLSSEMSEFFKAFNTVKKLNSGTDEKMKIMKTVIKDVSMKIHGIIEQNIGDENETDS